jgi:hypothetical protein
MTTVEFLARASKNYTEMMISCPGSFNKLVEGCRAKNLKTSASREMHRRRESVARLLHALSLEVFRQLKQFQRPRGDDLWLISFKQERSPHSIG